MRTLKYLSYSSFTLFESQPETFYRRYLADDRPPRDPQNHYMAVGSAFDAYVKVDLHKRFVDDGDPKYAFQTLFEAQVEPQCRDQALVDGKTVYDAYKKSGAYADLCIDMDNCINPRFEADIDAEITHPKLEGSIKLFGKPDVMYINKHGARVIHDFKVNGFYSNSPPSPKTGYLKMFPGLSMHKSVVPRKHKGFTINGSAFIHSNCLDWSEQLSIYAWVMGEDVGSDYILSVDQLVCNKHKKEIRVAKHAGLCSDTWQHDLFRRLHRCWYACKNEHVFVDLPYEESKGRQEAIDLELKNPGDDLFREMTGSKKRER